MTSGRSPAMFCSRARYAASRSLRLQVDVERQEVDEGQVEVLRRREVDVGHERARVLVLRRLVQAPQEALRSAGARASARSGRGSRCRSRRPAAPDGPLQARTPARTRLSMERTSARSSRKATCCSQGSPTSTRRPCSAAASSSHSGGTVYVRTALIPQRRHGCEVRSDDLGRRELAAVLVRPEGAVGDAAHEQLLLPRVEELPADGRSIACGPVLRRAIREGRRGGGPHVGGRDEGRSRRRLQRRERRAPTRQPWRERPCPLSGFHRSAPRRSARLLVAAQRLITTGVRDGLDELDERPADRG